jgi:hypothetical protein
MRPTSSRPSPPHELMHWSTRRALDAVAKKGHAALDADLLDTLGHDASTRTEVEGVRDPRLPSARVPRRAVPRARPATQRELVDRS